MNKVTNATKYLKYVKAWENDPQLKNWITPMAGDIKAAYCKVCRRPLHPHKKDLLLHSKCKKHINNMLRYETAIKSCQPMKDAAIEREEFDINPMSSGLKKIEISFYPDSPNIIHNVLEENQVVEDAAIVINEDENLPFSPEDLDCWKNIPEFQGWLNVKSKQLSCNVCKKELKPNKTFLLKHAAGKIHRNKCSKKNINVSNHISNEMEDYRKSVAFGSASTELNEKIIDLRSDTVIKPSDEMKEAMMKANLGDDYFGNDSIVKDLESKVATLLGKECGLLAPSGTMANLIAVMSHCWSRDSEVILGDQSHLYRYSQGSLARLFGISTHPVNNERDGTFCLKALKDKVTLLQTSMYHPNILVCIENTHCFVGGKVLPMEWLAQLGEFCSQNGILLHMDGARLINACIFTGCKPNVITQHCNSSTLCLNKGFGAPMGSVLVGNSEFYDRAKSIRTLLGGTMHQSGLFAAAGLYTLEHNSSKLHWDHANARAIALCIQNLHSTAIRVELDDVQTNIVHLLTDNMRVNAQELCDRLAMVTENELRELGFEVKLFLTPLKTSIARIVTHGDLSKYDIQLISKKLKFVIEEYDNMLNITFERPS